jgi:nucleotidyltransferase/DNA polymerase involved in DNA repair
MPTVLEPIGAGITVALVNKFVINNNWLWQLCLGCQASKVDEHEEDISSTSTTASDTVEVHAHF